MSGEIRVTPPSVGDVLWAGQAYGFPPLEGEGISIHPGEEAWRAAVTPETAALVWATLRAADLEEGDAADADYENDAIDLGQHEDGDG